MGWVGFGGMGVATPEASTPGLRPPSLDHAEMEKSRIYNDLEK